MLPMFRIIHRNRRRRYMNERLLAARRNIRESHDPFSLPEQRFIELYRLNKQLARHLINLLRPHLIAPMSRRGISVEKKIIVALRFYATGSYQRSVGEEYNCGLSQACVHFCIHDVTRAITTHLAAHHIKFPNTIAQRNDIKQQFMHMFGFPGVVGAIDGTHVAILKPVEDEHNFINRKGFHSINCQLISDAHLKILNIHANFGGSSHDSFIWSRSQIKPYMENIHQHGEVGWLLGDSGYPQSVILMTPFRDPVEGTPESRYNKAHIRARNTVERCIGMLKGRFRCLLRERTARYKPDFVCALIKACAVLHNMCLDHNLMIENEPEEDVIDDVAIHRQFVQLQDREGLRARQRIVERYFL